MDKRRAMDIASSPVMANVTYHTEPIYIESVRQDAETAIIHPLNEPNNSLEVPLDTLKEE
jgi:small acid-soluble spore protein H (minor)